MEIIVRYGRKPRGMLGADFEKVAGGWVMGGADWRRRESGGDGVFANAATEWG